MNIPPKYEDVVAQLEAALGREAALREELHNAHVAASDTHGLIESYEESKKSLQQRLTVAEQNSEHWRGVSSEATCRAAALNERVGELEMALTPPNKPLKGDERIPLFEKAYTLEASEKDRRTVLAWLRSQRKKGGYINSDLHGLYYGFSMGIDIAISIAALKPAEEGEES